jgi:hypothetical protein
MKTGLGVDRIQAVRLVPTAGAPVDIEEAVNVRGRER